MSVVYLQERIKELQKRVQELEVELALYKGGEEVQKIDMRTIAERAEAAEGLNGKLTLDAQK